MSARHTRDLLERAGHDPATPIIRVPAGGESEEVVDLAYAVERLEASYTLSTQEIADVLATGASLRTPFAFYREPFAQRMMPGQIPYTREERERRSRLVGAAAAGDPGEQAEPLPVCNPTYRHRLADGVMAHLEYDPERGTVLVPDAACKAVQR